MEDPESVDAAFATVEAELGPVAVLVNNAGVTADGLVMRMSDDAWQRVLAVDLTGAFHTVRRATPKMMRARFGRIVNVSSVVAHVGGAGQANYGAAKAGLVGLSRSVARELGGRGITCNVVAPGPIATEMTAAMGPEWLETVGALVPVGRAGTPEEVRGGDRVPRLRCGRVRQRGRGPRRRRPRHGDLKHLTEPPPAPRRRLQLDAGAARGGRRS